MMDAAGFAKKVELCVKLIQARINLDLLPNVLLCNAR